MTDLPPIAFDLTPEGRAKAEAARAHLERMRRERNEQDEHIDRHRKTT